MWVCESYVSIDELFNSQESNFILDVWLYSLEDGFDSCCVSYLSITTHSGNLIFNISCK